MKYEDYESKLTGVVSNPDSAPIAVQEILKDLKSDAATMDSMAAELSEKDAKIRELQDTNTKLFLQVTGTDSSDDKPEDWSELEGDEALEAFIEAHKEEK